MITKLNHLFNFGRHTNFFGLKRLLHKSILVICLLTTNVLLHSQSIEAFLNANPKIANEVVWCTQASPLIEVAYADWDPAMKSELQDLYDGIAIGNYPDFAQPFDNLYDAEGGYSTYISMENGKTAYMAYLATSLYFEMNNTFSWKIADYNAEQISRIVNYKSFLDPRSNADTNYQQSFRLSNSMFAPPAFLMPGFFEKYNIIEPTSDYETFTNILEYSKGLRHFSGYYNFDDFENHWQYRGVPPAQRIIEGTTRTSDNIFASFTAGCHGTNSFYMTICRLINIPVVYTRNSGHAVPFVPTIDSMFITHGDDPYNKINKSMDLHNKNLLVNKFHLQSVGYGGIEFVGSRVWALDINEFSYYTKSRFCRESMPDYTNPELSIIVNTYGEAFLDSIRYLDRLFYTLKEEGYSNTCTGPTDYVEYPINWTSTSNVNTADKRLIKTNSQQPFAARSNTLIQDGHWVEAVVYNTQPDTWLGLDPSTADQDLNQIEYAIGMSDNRVEVYNFGNLVFETVNPHNFSIAYLKISVDNNQVKYAINGHTLYQQSLSNPNLEYTVFAGGSDELSEINTIVSNSQELATGTSGGCTAGKNCNDGDACTIGDVYDAYCNCAGVIVDTDGDGVCDADDQCPGFDDTLIGTACDDGNACTIGETYNTSCGCTGGTFQDADGDGVCDANDICPDGDDTIDSDNDGTPDACDNCSTVGQSCNDNDNCTSNDVYDADCNCVGVFMDADNDGICDANDICPGGDDTIDTDNDGTPDACDNCSAAGQSCNDNDSCTSNDVYDANCNCVGVFMDADNDGVCDAMDQCPDLDDSLIGQACDDDNPNTSGDAWDANCNCTGSTANLTCASSGNNVNYEYIAGVAIGSINNTTGANAGYANFTAQSTDVELGKNYPVILTPGFLGTAYNEYWSIWIDFNKNGDFTDAGENVFNGNGSGTVNGAVSIPSNVLTGSTTMRITMKYNSSPSPCENFAYGEVEDYSINVLAACTIGVSCDDNDACTTNDQYDSNCNCVGIILPDSDNDGICDIQDQCPNLDDNLIGTPCDDNDVCTQGETWDINCNCSGGTYTDNDNDGVCVGSDTDDSDACIPDNTNSNCNTSGDCQELSFAQFETGMDIWNDGGSDCLRKNNNIHNNSGSNSVRLRDNSGIQSSLFSDNLDLSSFAEVIVSFSFIGVSMDPGEDFFLEVSTDGGTNFTLVQEWNSGVEFFNNVRQNPSVTIPSGSLSNNTVIRFRCDASTNSDRIFLDDVRIETCGTNLTTLDVNEKLSGGERDKTKAGFRGSFDDLLGTRNGTDELTLSLYPNPVMDVLNIEIPEAKELAGTITIYSISGKKVYETDADLAGVNVIATRYLDSDQIYMCRITTESGQVLMKKFIKL